MQKTTHIKKSNSNSNFQPNENSKENTLHDFKERKLCQVLPNGQTPVFLWNYRAFCCGYRNIINQGGTSSGKNWAILELALSICATYPNVTFTVFGHTVRTLKKDAYKIAKIIHDNSTVNFKSKVMQITKEPLQFLFNNGSVLEFSPLVDEATAKAGKRNFSYFNEVNYMEYELVKEATIRTQKNTKTNIGGQIFFDYNPTNEFWIHEKFLSDNNTKWIISNYSHNFNTKNKRSHLDPQIGKELEALKETDEELYKSYALGKTGKIREIIFPNFEVVSTMPSPKEIFKKSYGLDFGFSPDPVAIVEIIQTVNNQFYFKELLYKNGIFNKDIFQAFKSFGYNNELIIADSAEPKTIEELKRMGLNIQGANKFAGSVNYSIKQIQQVLGSKPLHIFEGSINLIKEIKGYKNRKKDGTVLAEVDKTCLDHAIDAIRYGFEVFYTKKTLWGVKR
jgi:phage terminase large subunit